MDINCLKKKKNDKFNEIENILKNASKSCSNYRYDELQNPLDYIKRCSPVNVPAGGCSSNELPLTLIGVHSLKNEVAE